MGNSHEPVIVAACHDIVTAQCRRAEGNSLLMAQTVTPCARRLSTPWACTNIYRVALYYRFIIKKKYRNVFTFKDHLRRQLYADNESGCKQKKNLSSIDTNEETANNRVMWRHYTEGVTSNQLGRWPGVRRVSNALIVNQAFLSFTKHDDLKLNTYGYSDTSLY